MDVEESEQLWSIDESLAKLVRTPTFIDKTMGIKCLFEKVTDQPEKCYILTAPKGFGKSTNLKLLKTFLEIPVDHNGIRMDKSASKNYDFFADAELDIFKDTSFFEENFAQHATIYIDLKNLRTTCHDVSIYLQHLIRDLLKQYSYLPELRPYFYPQERRPADFNISHIKALTESIFKNYQKPCFVLFDMDEPLYNDKPQNPNLKSNCNYCGYSDFHSSYCTRPNSSFEVTSFLKDMKPLQNLLDALLDDNCVKKIIISRSVSGEKWFNKTHFRSMIKYHNLFESKILTKYYGFTLKDVSSLMLGREIWLEDMKTYFGGYLVEGSKEPIFSMHSVLEFLKTGILQTYAFEPPLPEFVKSQLLSNHVCKLIQDAFVFQISSEYNDFYYNQPLHTTTQELETVLVSKHDVALQYLTDCGYFTINFELYHDRKINALRPNHGTFVTLSVPNAEMRLKLEKLLYQNNYYGNRYQITKEKEQDFSAALNNLNSTEKTYQTLADVIADFFKSTKPQNTAELVGPLMSCVRFNESFKAHKRYFFSKYGERLFIRRNDGTGIVLQMTCDEVSAFEALKMILDSNADVLDEIAAMERKIFIGLQYNSSGCTLSYLYNNFNMAEVKLVVSNKV